MCGRCINECPQQAKHIINQLQNLRVAVESGKQTIISLAPSYIAAFPGYTLAQLAERLMTAGITAVLETAETAGVISKIYQEYLQVDIKRQHTIISSCCPVVVNLIERYYPELIGNLAPVISPMLAHAKLIKAQYGQGSFVVFAGPCIAKIAEGTTPASEVDAVITFEQLRQLLGQESCLGEKISVAQSCPSSFAGRCFPVTGGILLPYIDQGSEQDIIAADGIENCLEVFEAIKSRDFFPKFIEAMACSGGCIGGPAIGTCQLMQVKRNKVLAYARTAATDESKALAVISELDLSRSYEARPVHAIWPKEDEIREILRQTGKLSAEDEKNCGACGYDTCRAKAVAVYQGLAELDMCVPYTRSKAESFANIIVENSLNAIIAVNEKMIIMEFNPAVNRMFGAAKAIYSGMNLQELFDCSDFIDVAKSGHKIVGKRVEYHLHGIVTEQMIIPVLEHDLVIAIITDITAYEQKASELQQMKLDTVEKATEIINKQMHVAQEIAGLLGETTAETKSALLELIMLIKGKEGL